MQDTYALTESQRELAGKNHRLIYKFAKIKEADLEEFYGVLAIGLCKAARAYDASSGYKFSTLAYRCMDNEYKMYWRAECVSKHIPSNMILSYNKEVVEFFNSLTDIQKIVLNGLMSGYKERELAEYTGFSRSYINHIKKTIRKKASLRWTV